MLSIQEIKLTIETLKKFKAKDYEEFFKSAMKKFGIKSPADLDDDEKKKTVKRHN